jgi:hypothetical protein
MNWTSVVEGCLCGLFAVFLFAVIYGVRYGALWLRGEP